MVGEVACRILDNPDAQIANRERAPAGLSGFTRMNRRLNAIPIRYGEWQRRELHCAPPLGFSIGGVGSLRQRDDLPRIHDVQRIERTLDLAHDVQTRAELRLQVLHLALADAVLPGAGAVHRDSALGKALEEV